MTVNGVIIFVLIGTIIGIIIAGKVGIGDIINESYKIKTRGENNSPIVRIKPTEPPKVRKGIFRKIFKRREK